MRLKAALFVALLAIVVAAPLFALDGSNVLVIANEKAEGSVEIAEYYADLRGVPASQILKISTSDKEEITRDEFNREILEPVRKYVLANEKILILVPTRGVPLKVKDQDGKAAGAFEGHDEASVDGELTLVREIDFKIDGAIENPFLNKDEPLTLEHKVVIVCRLDGQTVAMAKGLVEKAILAECLTPEGHSYLDTRGLTSNDGYQQRDDVMERVEDVWKAMGIPYTHDTNPAVVDLSTFKDPLHYYGWYAGSQKPAGAVKFRTGGIDIHLHSFAGATVRNPDRNWVGPLLSWNATATYGTTYEPYTTGFPYENIFWDRLSKGYTFGEAGLMANHLISWQAVFVGDPLYRPYPKDWATRKERARAALSNLLVPPESGAKDGAVDGAEVPPTDVQEFPLLAQAQKLLNAREEAIRPLVRKDAAAAMALFEDARFLVQDLGQEAWLRKIAKPFEDELAAQFSNMKAAIKDDITNTAAFEAALEQWKGLAIHAKLEEFKAELAKDQEKAAAKLLKKAQADAKRKNWLKAWQNASEAAAHKFAESAAGASTLMAEIKGNEPAVEEMKKDADKELKPIVEKAQKDFDRKKYDAAAKSLGTAWRHYPDCDQRLAAETLHAKIVKELNKG